MGAIYVPQDTRMGDLTNTLMGIMKIQDMRKTQKRQDAAIQLQTLMELGGSPDEGTLADISKNLGINPTLLTSIMKEGKFPSASERRISEQKGTVKAQAEAGAEVEPITTKTEISRRQKLLPVTKEEEQAKLDLQFENQKKLMEEQYNMEVKKSKNITIPEFKQTHDYLLSNEKELLTEKLNSEKELAKYGRTLSATPTPKEAAEIESLKAHSEYYKAAADYQTNVRKLIAGANKENKDFINNLKQHTQFMKDNQSLFYTKGKGGKIAPKEYDIGSKEEIDMKNMLDAAGIKYNVSEQSHWLGSNKHVFIPIAPDAPKQSSMPTDTGITIKSYTDKNVTLGNGRTLMRNPDGTVTINGQTYQVSEE